MALVQDIKDQRSKAEDWLGPKRVKWDKWENLFYGILDDAISGTTKSQIFDPKLQNLLLDRSARVMAQMGVGKVKGISKDDQGGSQILSLLMDKYVVPNANAQFDFLTKMRMMDLYSNVYGNFFAMVDWDVKRNGYVGPDMWLLNIRDIFPQVGAISLEDSDFVIVRSWKPISYFERMAKQPGYKNMSKIITALEAKPGKKESRDANSTDKRELDQLSEATTMKGKGYYEVLSRYERDRWVDYVSDADEIMRDGKNPHDDDELPVFNKYSIPVISDFMGMGDTERGGSMQGVVNSNWNLYMDSVKMSIYPPVMINKDNIADASSIKRSAGAKWLMKGQLGNAAQVLNLNPGGQSTFNNVYQIANSSLMGIFGTSDTNTTAQTDPGFGRTPQALKMQESRENARDNVDRFYMEQFLNKVGKKMCNLLVKKLPKQTTVRMFKAEIDQIAKVYPDVKEMYDEKKGKMTVKKGDFTSDLYDYEIVSGSTFMVDQKQQQENLMQLITLVTTGLQMGQNGEASSPIIDILKQDGKKVNLGEAITRLVSNSGIKDWDKIIEDENGGQGGNQDLMKILQDHANQFAQAAQGQGGAMGGVNGIPVPPQGMPQGQPIPQQMPPQMPQMGGMQ